MPDHVESVPDSRPPFFGFASTSRLIVSSASAALFLGGLAALLAVNSHATSTLAITIGFGSALVAIALVIGSQASAWRKEGGRLRAAEIDEWIRVDQLPETPLPFRTVAHLAQRAEHLSRFWSTVILAVIWSINAVSKLVSEPTAVDAVFATGLATCSIASVAVAAYSRFRTLPRVQRLLADAKAREATPALSE